MSKGQLSRLLSDRKINANLTEEQIAKKREYGKAYYHGHKIKPHRKKLSRMRCPRCLSTQIYHRTKRQLLSRMEWKVFIKVENRGDEIVKLDIPSYRCDRCGLEFDDPTNYKRENK